MKWLGRVIYVYILLYRGFLISMIVLIGKFLLLILMIELIGKVLPRILMLGNLLLISMFGNFLLILMLGKGCCIRKDCK